ncbi:MAG TPA: FIST N-terminal domain-containing protein [Patescibacteria group bacterium]|nr:FIST N-terminal domain-containing protein [Patescibacteria group bacterium]
MTSVGVGISQNASFQTAFEEALSQSLRHFQNQSPDIVFLFADTSYPQEELAAYAKKKLPERTLIVGASSPSLFTKKGISEKSLGVVAIKSCSMTFDTSFVPLQKEDPYQNGKNLVGSLPYVHIAPKLYMLLYDGLNSYGQKVIHGVTSQLGTHFPIIGISSSDNFRFRETYQYFQHKAFQHSAIGISVSGTFSFGIGVRHGWTPVGAYGTVTKSLGGKVYEIDEKPAIEFYRSFFDQKIDLFSHSTFSQPAMTYPLGVSVDTSSKLVIRTPYRFLPDGSIEFVTEIPTHTKVHLMIGTNDESLSTTTMAVRQAKDVLINAHPYLAFVFSGLMRKKLLGRKNQEDIHRLSQELGSIPFLGIHGYSQIGPLYGQTYCSQSVVHNESVVVVILAEESKRI